MSAQYYYLPDAYYCCFALARLTLKRNNLGITLGINSPIINIHTA